MAARACRQRTIEPEGQRMTSNAAERYCWMRYEDILVRTQRSHSQKHFSSKTTSFRLHFVRGHMPQMSTYFGRRVGLGYQNGALFCGITCCGNAELFPPYPSRFCNHRGEIPPRRIAGISAFGNFCIFVVRSCSSGTGFHVMLQSCESVDNRNIQSQGAWT